MKKKFLTTLLIISISIIFIGCNKNKNTSTKESSGDTISSEEGLLNVEVTLPKSFFSDKDASTIETEAKAEGIKDVKVNNNGSVTYKMNKSTHKKLLENLKKGTDESIAKIIEDKKNFPSFDNITYNDDLTEFNIFVDKQSYNSIQSLGVLAFYFTGNMYQAMNCVSSDKINTTVNFIDSSTKEVIESGNSKDMGNSFN